MTGCVHGIRGPECPECPNRVMVPAMTIDLDELGRKAKKVDAQNRDEGVAWAVGLSPAEVLALIARVRELEAAIPRCGCGSTSSTRGDPECDACGKDCYYCTCKQTKDTNA